MDQQSPTITPVKETELSLVIDNFEGEAEQAYMDEIGTLIFQSALMRYLVSESEETAQEFENYIEENIKSETFMEKLCEKYPNFKEVLEEEMVAFANEMRSLN